MSGEIDAANADAIAAHVQQCADCCEWLILDCSQLDFIGISGFSALQTIAAGCAGGGTRWMLVPGPAVARLLRICDRESQLPTVESVSLALADMQDPRRFLQLVVPHLG